MYQVVSNHDLETVEVVVDKNGKFLSALAALLEAASVSVVEYGCISVDFENHYLTGEKFIEVAHAMIVRG